MSALEKYTLKRFSRLKKLLRSYSSDPQVETLHGIRVEIKKVKVILRLINEYEKGFHAHRHFVPLREIFRKAGEIRQPQVYYELLLRHEIQGVDDSLIPGSSAQARLSRDFRREIPVYISVVRIRKNKLGEFLNEISGGQIRKYVKGRKEALRLMLQGNLAANALHKARKVIKEIMYLEAVTKKAGKRDLFFSQMEELIGQWHDRQLLMDVLRKGKSFELKRLRSERNVVMRDIRKAIAEFYYRN